MSHGAWTIYDCADGTTTRWYKNTDPWTYFQRDSVKGLGCIAIKRELKRQGFGSTGFGTESPVIGVTAKKVIKDFQQAAGLTVDGVVGPATTKKLFKPLILQHETLNRIPDHRCWQIISLESAFDPGADGYVDPDDHGLAQINIVIRHITVQQAHDPSFSIPYLCSGIRGAINNIGDIDAAIASWNTGSYWASRWFAAGKPSQGAWDDKNQIDWYTRAHHYVYDLVYGQPLP